MLHKISNSILHAKLVSASFHQELSCWRCSSSRWNKALSPKNVYYLFHNHLALKQQFHGICSYKFNFCQNFCQVNINDVATSEGGKCKFSDTAIGNG